MTLKNIISSILLATFVALIAGCGAPKPILRVYTWSDYMDPELIKEFEQEFGCKVIVDDFDSNEMMYAKVKAGGTGYDIIHPSSYMVKIMRDQGMLRKLDLSQIPNAQLIDKDYLEQFSIDKKMEYSIPFMLGYACIAYNKAKLGEMPPTWAVYDDQKLRNRTTLLNDMRETIGAALKYKGYSLNTTSEKELEEAKEVLMRWKENVARFENEAYKGGIASGEYHLVLGYKGDLYQAIEENPDIEIIIPKEGTSVSCDDWVIPVGANNLELANEFINFMLEPENNAQNMMFNMYNAPMQKAFEYLPEDLRNMPSFIVPKEIMDKSEMIMDLGADNVKYIKIWDDIKKD